MKKTILFLFITVISTALFAQDQAKPTTQPPASGQQAKPAKAVVTHKVIIKNYCCPACDFTSQKPGACPNHKKALIRDGMFYCEDGTTSREAGICADGKAMVKMVDKSSKKGEVRTVPAAK